ncbi:NACHT, LRR and PYD domains-containing protein 13 isoform X1 [Cynara cardunculus var. scolymus]|uniref:Leucine-rich repeat, ribonuclease inhibitor subtype n=1 Tax=Cynara cardunculus var. scolymus TaxID=59895 RepID=A0A124SID0_CYNCS|nr:NACHT, LRR and PYD domains-containing protein 13 isoform X1 [Cynara cardunculus var. scolymus]KVI12316.1 Leucine-rich repeat, ribonuclease inhibitor subtype [Cynara cardunculus var. scolymus]
MSEVPSLITLCIGAIKNAILDENGNLPYVYKLPSELFDRLLPHLPPLALQNLQDAMPSVSSNDYWFSDDCLKPSRKRKRFENFDIAWKALYKSRWSVIQKLSVDFLPEDVQQDEPITNWQQIYWEKHLQNCLDAAAEMVSITLFDGCLGDVEIPDALLKYISYEGNLSRSRSYLKLAYHCERFGLYARCLRLQSVHCVAEIGHLLRKSRLEFLEVHWIKSKEQVEGLCKVLEQNKETLASIEFIHCKLPASLVTAICESLHVKDFETNVIKNFSIKRSSFLDSSYFPLPLGLESLLSAASGLTSLVLSDNHMWWKTAKMVFDTLLDTDSGLQVLDLSENNIAGWLSHFKWGSPSLINSDRQIDKYLKSLRVLNLRSNNLQKDDADCLKYAMVYMPNLEVLNLSDNPLQDDGIRIFVPYLVKKSKCDIPLAELYLDNCELSCHGASQLLKVLSALNVPLKSLSIGDNHLTSKFGPSLGKFLLSGIQALNVKGVGLGSSGFSDAQEEITEELSLVRINISDNCGGIRTANFLSKMISQAPNLVSVNASNNWMPMESLPTICSVLKAAKGKLEHLDLRQNTLCNKGNIASLLAEFQINGKPNILLSSPAASIVLYDNDP